MIKASVMALMLFSASVALAEDNKISKPVFCYNTESLENLIKQHGEIPFMKYLDPIVGLNVSITLNPDTGSLTIYESHPEEPEISCVISSGENSFVFKPILRYILREEVAT